MTHKPLEFDVVIDEPEKTVKDKTTGLPVVKSARRHTVRVVIDLELMKKTVCHDAVYNRSGKARMGGKVIVARCLR